MRHCSEGRARARCTAVAKEMGLPVLEIETEASLPAGQFRINTGSRDGIATQAPCAPHDIALILHTSGTTARPKIVPLSHRNLVASARSIAEHLALTPTDRCLNVMPLFHIHGLVGALLATLAGGASIVCTPGFDDRTFFDGSRQFEPTWYTAVPTIHQSVVAHGARYRQAAPNHQFRFVRSSSSALPPKTFESLQTLTGAPVVEAYGMTEASHQMASNPLSGKRKPGSVGLPAGVEIALMDDAGHLLAAGATGEIVIRGPGVTAGYENNPRGQCRRLHRRLVQDRRPGPLRRRRLSVHFRAPEGDRQPRRRKNLAARNRRGAARASRRRASRRLRGSASDAWVRIWPRRSCFATGAKADEAGLRSFLFARLADFKVPSAVVFVDAIPSGATGKVQRTSLYEKLGHLIAKAYVAPSTETRTVARIDLPRRARLRADRRARQLLRPRWRFAEGSSGNGAHQDAASKPSLRYRRCSAIRRSAMLAVEVEAVHSGCQRLVKSSSPPKSSRCPTRKFRGFSPRKRRQPMDALQGTERQALLRLLRSKRRCTGDEIIAASLRRLGITHVYGVSGAPIYGTLASCAQIGLRVIGARHQQGAVLMSLAHNYVSGGLRSAVIVSAGPAVTNCTTGVLIGRQNRWPLLVIGGRRALSVPGGFQEFDGAHLLAPIAKWTALAATTGALSAILEQAAWTAISGPPGPVYIDVAEEAISGQAECSEQGIAGPLPPPSFAGIAGRAVADPRGVDEAVSLLTQARRPVMLLGKGARWCEPSRALLRLADEFEVPFATSPMGRGLLADDHPLCFSGVRGRMLAEADLVFVVGTRLDWTFRHGTEISPQARVVQIDTDSIEAAGRACARRLPAGGRCDGTAATSRRPRC